MAIGARIHAFQCGFDVSQLGRFVFVHGELVVALGYGLGLVIQAAYIVLSGHVRARNQTAALLGDALQQLRALMQEALAVGGEGWGVG
jgi:hypothetical protein